MSSNRTPLIVLLVLLLTSGAVLVWADDVNVEASATFRTALATSVEQHMDFGLIEFSQPDIGDVTLAVDGSLTYGTGTGGSGTAMPAIIDVAGQTGNSVSISCSANTSLYNGSHLLSLNMINYRVGTVGGTTTCAGLGSTSSFTISGDQAENKISLGGTLSNPAGNVTSSTYDTSLTAPITVRLLYL